MSRHGALEMKLRKIQQNVRIEIADLAEEFRATTLLPFCRQYRLTFLSGNGTWYFSNRLGDTVSAQEMTRASMRKTFLRIEEQLSATALGRDELFGFYVRDISAADWEIPAQPSKRGAP